MNTIESSKRNKQDDFNLDDKNNRLTRIIDLVGSQKTVLEIGTSTGYVSKILMERGNKVFGLEPDARAGHIASQYCEQMIIADIESLDPATYYEPSYFDIILCRDVFQYTRNVPALLIPLKKYLKPGGYIVACLPNFCHGDVILRILMGEFPYFSHIVSDRTPIQFFSLKNMYSLFSECGYEIQNLQKTSADIGTTELKLSPELISPALLQFIQSLPDSRTYQFICTAHPNSVVTPPTFEDPDMNCIVYNILEDYCQETRFALAELLEKYQFLAAELSGKNEYILNLEKHLENKKIIVHILKRILCTIQCLPLKKTKTRTLVDTLYTVGTIYNNEGIRILVKKIISRVYAGMKNRIGNKK